MAKNISGIISGAGWLASFADALIKAAWERGIPDEEIHRLAADTKEGKALIAKIIDLFAQARRNLADMIAAWKFNDVDRNINETNFPPQPIRGKIKIYHFNRYISSEDVIAEMAKDGYLPANIYELLNWDGWKGEDVVVALGSVWQHLGGRDVPSLWGDAGRRRLLLDWFKDDWVADCRFAAVRKSAEDFCSLEISS